MAKNSWVQRQSRDIWVQKAKKEGYLSRASFKLLDIAKKDKLFRPGALVVDLGSAPGGWSQVASKAIGAHGEVIATDLLDSLSGGNVTFVQGDFTEAEIEQKLLDLIKSRPVDLVMSDMAPNMSGIAVADQAKSIYLCELALDFATKVLSPKGALLVKVFQGSGFEAYLKMLRGLFKEVKSRKPEASRTESREIYLLAKGIKPQ